MVKNYDARARFGKPTWFALVFLLIFTHCGYTLQHRLKESFQAPNGIFVPVFDNLTNETGAERVFTNALIRELTSRHEVVLGTRENGAIELRGVLERIDASPTAYTEPGFKGLAPFKRLPSEIGVSVSLTLTLMVTGRVEWVKSFQGYRRVNAPLKRTFDFEAPSSVGPITQSLVFSTYFEIARDIMRDVYDEMVENF